ncbi:MAG: type II toxin-antitoxin system VapC family toxin [Burkholderiaceae bacterium]|jgi:predicted nucleic acid-binding protein|nr:type II toxin-antitoxin system VapC family toxin [Burkholderiaceae bacterium]
MLLVDTNVLGELMRQRPDPGVEQWMKALPDGENLFFSVITVDEICYVLSRKPNQAKQRWFDHFVAAHTIVDITGTIARRAGEMRALLSLRGQVRSQADMLIAATAQTHALTLVTRNVRDFDGCGIAVLNPFSA